jgi:hypothetical protein
VAKHIFQACPVWIYTQSNITQAFRTMFVASLRSINASIYFFVDGFRFFRRCPTVVCSTNKCCRGELNKLRLQQNRPKLRLRRTALYHMRKLVCNYQSKIRLLFRALECALDN